MPLNREEHETLLAELLTPDLDHARKTEILSQMRDNYTDFTTTHETLSKSAEKLKKDNEDLIISNSKLFRQTGVFGEPANKEKEDKKTFSETITIEAIEKGL